MSNGIEAMVQILLDAPSTLAEWKPPNRHVKRGRSLGVAADRLDEILELKRKGLNYREIGDIIGVSSNTISRHIKQHEATLTT